MYFVPLFLDTCRYYNHSGTVKRFVLQNNYLLYLRRLLILRHSNLRTSGARCLLRSIYKDNNYCTKLNPFWEAWAHYEMHNCIKTSHSTSIVYFSIGAKRWNNRDWQSDAYTSMHAHKMITKKPERLDPCLLVGILPAARDQWNAFRHLWLFFHRPYSIRKTQNVLRKQYVLANKVLPLSNPSILEHYM